MSDNTTANLWHQLGASRRAILQDALDKAGGSAPKAAAALGVNRTDMYRMLDDAGLEYTVARAADGPAQMAARVLAQYGHWLRAVDDRLEPDRRVTKWLKEQAREIASRGDTETERRRNQRVAFRLCSGRTHAAVAASLRRLLKAERKAAQAKEGV